MRVSESAGFAKAFVRTRWGLRFKDRSSLEAWQQRQVTAFLSKHLQKTAFYRGCSGKSLSELPIVDKATTLAHFAGFNRHAISLEQATAVALAAEESRDFRPTLDAGLTVGLSSGTQGPRGVFLASPQERATWAGILLARTLSSSLLRDMLLRREPLRVAFFLRANSRLYTTLASSRLDFRFFDLHAGVEPHLAGLQAFHPDVLVAPASLLAWIAAQGLCGLQPRKVVSVAEVLEPDDERRIRDSFGVSVDQIYQCTEGFLGYTCEHGSLHLNEEYVHFEPEWLDDSRTRFVPLVTDFTRTTQLVVRHRLTDVLTLQPGRCPCGRHSRRLAAVAGRLDDVLWLPSRNDGRMLALFPDVLRHTFTRQARSLPDYRLVQVGQVFELAVEGNDTGAYEAMVHAVNDTAARLSMVPPSWRQRLMPAASPANKRRRIVCQQKPGGSPHA